MRNPPRGAAALLALVVAAGLAGTATVTVAEANSPGDAAATGKDKIKNVIYLLGDGMGRTHVTAARERYYGAAGKLDMETAPGGRPGADLRRPEEVRAARRARLQPNFVTDSASAATAWASGVKTYNAALGVDAKGKVVPTIMELAKKAGLRTGNVSTAEITDATPAGQMSHVLLRGCQGPTYSAAPARTPPSPDAAPDDRRPGDTDRGPDRPQRHRGRHPRRRAVPLRRGRRGRAARRRATTVLGSPRDRQTRRDRGRPGRAPARKGLRPLQHAAT